MGSAPLPDVHVACLVLNLKSQMSPDFGQEPHKVHMWLISGWSKSVLFLFLLLCIQSKLTGPTDSHADTWLMNS